jgi:hypothetical protein
MGSIRGVSRTCGIGPALVLLLAAICAEVSPAQGAVSLSTYPTASPNNSNGGVMFEVTPATGISIYRLGAYTSSATTTGVEIWHRVGGMGVPPSPAPATGWVNDGTVTTAFTAATITQIPLNLNLVIPSGQTWSFVVALKAGSLSYYTVPSLPAVVSNTQVTINYGGWAGPYFGGAPGMTPLNQPRGWVGTMWYDLAQLPGASAQVKDIASSTGLPHAGNNTVRVTIRNGGSTDLSGNPITLQYSTDGGASFPASQSQSFSLPPALLPLQDAVLDMTTAVPWAVGAIGPSTLVVRVNPTIGNTNTTLVRTFVPDPDVSAVSIGGSDPSPGSNIVTVTVTNNGGFDLNGVPLTLRYSTDGGVTFATQTYAPTSLNLQGASQTFAFSTPWLITGTGAVSVLAELATALNGDPDASNLLSRSWASAGQPGTNWEALLTATTGMDTPFSNTYSSYKLQTFWTPTQLNSFTGLITEFGMPFTTAITGSLGNVRILMGECDLGALATPGFLGTTFASNYNIVSAPAKTVFDGPLFVSTKAGGETWRAVLSDPFWYSGQNVLLVTLLVSGSQVATLSYYASSGNQRVSASNQGDTATGASSTGTGWRASFRFLSSVSGAALVVSDPRLAAPAAVGNNFVQCTVYNPGTVGFSGTSFTLEYSTDGGATWAASQSFTPPSLAPQSSAVFAFTSPWTVTSAQTLKLAVRLNPVIGPLSTPRYRTYVADADVTAVSTLPAVPVVGSNTVSVTVQNNGEVSLNGSPLSVGFSDDGGGSYTTAAFTPTTLAAKGDTQTFAFSAPWVITTGGSLLLTAALVPAPVGDPDAWDRISKAFSAPAQGTVYSQSGTGSVPDPFSFNGTYASLKYQQAYTPAQLGNLTGDICEFGFVASSTTSDTIPSVRIELGETTLTSLPITSPFAANYNVPGKGPVTVFNGALTVDTVSGQPWRVPLQTSFYYSGANRLLVTILVIGSQSSLSTTASTSLTPLRLIHCGIRPTGLIQTTVSANAA